MTSPLNPFVFRAYDIRGNAQQDLTNDFCYRLGEAIGILLHQHITKSKTTTPKKFVVGRDCRPSSNRIFHELTKGLVSTGLHIIDLGIVPTPVVYFAEHHCTADGHIVVTGSHNPSTENGFKIGFQKQTLQSDSIQMLRKLVEQPQTMQAQTIGTIKQFDATTPYTTYIQKSLRLGKRRTHIVVDAGNGTGGIIAAPLYRAMGFQVTEMYCEPDGTFPQHHPDPSVKENMTELIDKVKTSGAELGIAFDGDADRLGVVDNQGRCIWGDQMMILFARDILKTNPDSTFLGEVKCSQAMFDAIEHAGGKPVMWKVGHSLIKSKMKDLNAALAGEMSGHLFFADRYLGFDDGIYAGARMLELLSHSDIHLDKIYESLPQMINTPEIRVDCPDEQKFQIVSEVTQRLRHHPDVVSIIDIDGVRANFAKGWSLLRASNTGPSLILRFEADSQQNLDIIRKTVEKEIHAIYPY